MKKTAALAFTVFGALSSSIAVGATHASFVENNQAKVSFDVTMPIDSTGYTLHGNNLTGGDIQFADTVTSIAPLLAHEAGNFQLPVVTSTEHKPLIKTTIDYKAIKFINLSGVDNLFIKVGVATRTQVVADLDPHVIKDGSYSWVVPIFSFGKEGTTVDNKSSNSQFMQVGSIGEPASTNSMYTQDFFIFSQGAGNAPIVGHPIRTNTSTQTLMAPHTDHFNCSARGLWGGDGADPYRKIVGKCAGTATVYPAGPNLDYEIGSFKLPSVHTPWTATKSDHCMFKGKFIPGCTKAKIDLTVRYMAQKIRVPINDKIEIFAEFGSAYRRITPDNLRYQCKNNVYIDKILPKSSCVKKSYLPGGAAYTYFAVGYEFKQKDGTRYTARFINIPGEENGNRLTWIDASETEIYATSVDGGSNANKESTIEIHKKFVAALDEIRKHPVLYNVLGKYFFAKVMKNTDPENPIDQVSQ